MLTRCQLQWWSSTGVAPTGAQVRRTTGSSETPLSSQTRSGPYYYNAGC